MLKILFVKPQNKIILKLATPPLGIMYISSYLRQYLKEDIRIKIIDNRLYGYNEEQLCQRIKEYNPSIVGISSITVEDGDMHAAARAAKRFNRKIVVIAGGHHPTQYYDEVIMDRNIDALVLGEGELTFLELVQNYMSGKGYDGVKGIAFRMDDQVVRAPERELMPDLDLIPFPAWDLIDMKAYFRVLSMSGILGYRKYMSILTSRGCSYECIYCHGLVGKYFRARSVEDVGREIDALVSRYGIYKLEILDDIFNLDYKRAQGILDFIISRSYKLKLSFPNGLRGDLLDYNILLKLKKAGTIACGVAMESASSRIHNMIKKELDINKTEEMVRMSSRLGMLTGSAFMLGFPGETREEMLSTINMAVKSELDLAYFFIVIPFKGTPLFEENKMMIAEKYKNVPFSDYNYFRGVFNLSSVSDKEFIKIQQMAYLRFYLYPRRILRILSKYLSFERGICSLVSNFLMMFIFIFLRRLDKAHLKAKKDAL